MSARRYVILAAGALTARQAKMTHGVLSYGADEVVAVVDPDYAGKRVRDVFPHLRRDAPIVASVDEALALRPTSLLVGIAPAGGALPEPYRAAIRRAITAGLEIVSGLHAMLGEDPELAPLAKANGAQIWDLRLPPPAPLFSGAAWDVRAKIVLTVGSDAAVGKMTASLELTAAARARGIDAAFVPTGQIGIAIAGWGTAIDRVVSDFAAGAAEQLVLEGERRAGDLLFLEGQGGIGNPAFSPVTLALVHGGAPDALVLVHDVARAVVEGYDLPIRPLPELIAAYEQLCAVVKPAKVVGVALNTRTLDDGAAQVAMARAAAQTGLPCADLVREGAAAFYDAIAPAILKREPLRA